MSGYGPPPYGYPPQGYPPQGYGQPYGYSPPASNGLAVAALVFGILSLVCFPGFGLIALPLGIAGVSRANRVGTGKGMGIAGIIMGVLGILASIAIVILLVASSNEINTDPADGVCNEDRYLQDPDC